MKEQPYVLKPEDKIPHPDEMWGPARPITQFGPIVTGICDAKVTGLFPDLPSLWTELEARVPLIEVKPLLYEPGTHPCLEYGYGNGDYDRGWIWEVPYGETIPQPRYSKAPRGWQLGPKRAFAPAMTVSAERVVVQREGAEVRVLHWAIRKAYESLVTHLARSIIDFRNEVGTFLEKSPSEVARLLNPVRICVDRPEQREAGKYWYDHTAQQIQWEFYVDLLAPGMGPEDWRFPKP
jgi:hypothetical protein